MIIWTCRGLKVYMDVWEGDGGYVRVWGEEVGVKGDYRGLRGHDSITQTGMVVCSTECDEHEV